MKTKTYSIFGAGAAGLYTAWRLLEGKPAHAKDKGKLLAKGDTLELYDWGKYDFSKQDPGTRAPGARVCTWHYKNDKNQSYLELGGMRYSDWDGTKNGQGHRLVTTVIKELGLDKDSVPFNESNNPLFCLRTKNMYLNDITSNNPAPYNVNNFGAAAQPDNGFSVLGNLAVTPQYPSTRREWCDFYQNGTIKVDMPDSSVFQKGDKLSDIGYWNLMYDQLGPEGFAYTADGNGYTSNVINWNSAVAFNSNNEFTPGNQYKTLTEGYSSMFDALFNRIVKLAKAKGVIFSYHPNTRLHSILQIDGVIRYSIATREHPNKKSATKSTDAAWLAMPRYAIDLVAQATRYETHEGIDVLNHKKVQLFLESAIMQPSYKVGMFFKTEWWKSAPYAPQLTGYVVTPDVLAALKKAKFPAAYLQAMTNGQYQGSAYVGYPFGDTAEFLKETEHLIQQRLTVVQEETLTKAAARDTIGPSVTDTPIRQVVYFGNNATGTSNKEAVYGLLASYDDEQFTSFWEELEDGPDQDEKIPLVDNLQPLIGPRKVPEDMSKMLRQQLAMLHYGPQADYSAVPPPIEAAYMDWSLPPFNAGYHAYAAHFNVCEVQQKIRKPSQLVEGADASIFIVGETYSNDQAWVEGAYCTAESVLNDFFGVAPIIDPTDYPFICPCG